MYNIVKQSCQNVLMVYNVIITCTCFPYEQRVNLYPCAQQHLKYSIKNNFRRVDGNDLITCPDVNIRALDYSIRDVRLRHRFNLDISIRHTTGLRRHP